MMVDARFWLPLLIAGILPLAAGLVWAAADEHPLSEGRRAELKLELLADVERLAKSIEADPRDVDAISRRGDAYFFLGEFDQALADYEQMVRLDPSLESSHWRRGIAYFYSEKYKDAAHQFEIYNTFDNVDRENGIWRFFSQLKAEGAETARKGLLKYEKDDREPFPSVYRLFAEDITPAEILSQIASADVSGAEREKRLFYAHLYIGLNEAIQDHREAAIKHLKRAVANTWAPKAGYGPRYMWHVGRLHYDLLATQPEN